jgi:hypothetical protein
MLHVFIRRQPKPFATRSFCAQGRMIAARVSKM